MNNILDVKIKEKKLVNESNIFGFIYNSDLENISNKDRAKSRAR